MATSLSTVDAAIDSLGDELRRKSSRIPALNMEEVELLSPTGDSASVWLGDESQGGMGVLVLGSAVGDMEWLQTGIQVHVRQGKRKRQAVVRHCTLDSPTVMFVGLEWVRKKRSPSP